MGSWLGGLLNILKNIGNPIGAITTGAAGAATGAGAATEQFISKPGDPGILGDIILGVLGVGMVMVGLFAMVGGGDTVVDVGADAAETAEPETAPEVKAAQEKIQSKNKREDTARRKKAA